MWCIAELSEECIERMEEVLDIYERPHNPKRPIACMDEKPVASFSDATPRLPPRRPGEVLLKGSEHQRAGRADVLCAASRR
jgi:hypothetical protein